MAAEKSTSTCISSPAEMSQIGEDAGAYKVSKLRVLAAGAAGAGLAGGLGFVP